MDEARIKILGVPFDPLGMEEAVERIASFMAVDQCHLVVTANPETVMKAGEDRELMAILQEAQLVVADGIGIVWAARCLGTPLPGRVPGVELAEALVALAAQRGYRVYLLGGAPGVAAEAARCLERKYPGLVIAGVQHGYFSREEEEGVVAAVASPGPIFCWWAWGCPSRKSGSTATGSGWGRRWPSASGGASMSLPGRSAGLPPGCAAGAWSGSTASPPSPSEFSGCWPCPALC